MNGVTVMVLFTSNSLIIIYFIKKFLLKILGKINYWRFFYRRPTKQWKKNYNQHLTTNSGKNLKLKLA